jgi:multidrug transporter EmrE-like cation transporter
MVEDRDDRARANIHEPPSLEPVDPGSGEGRAPQPALTAAPIESPSWARSRRWLPWGSLAAGIAGAVLMDRGPKHGLWVAAGAFGIWATLPAAHGLLQLEQRARPLGRVQRALLWALRYGSVVATQYFLQLCLFFAVPFYFRAAVLSAVEIDPGHALFMFGLCASCAVSLWDPWTEALLRRPLWAPLLPAAASFVALNAVLPALRLSTTRSLWLAAGTAMFGAAPTVLAHAPVERRKRAILAVFAMAIAIPLALWLGAARIVPPAPLRLVRAEFGTALNGKWIAEPVSQLNGAPERLICATAIEAPVGLRDRLFHVWRKDGRLVARMELDVVGGRHEGYRTRSWLTNFEKDGRGHYDCSVVTASGQMLGSAHVQIGR